MRGYPPMIRRRRIGRAPLPVAVLPSWVTSAVSRRWIEIPGDTLDDVDPGPGAWSGVSGQTHMVAAWNGAAFNADAGVMWFTAAGGHNDYWGNEVYRWDLHHATPNFSLVLAPSDLGSYSLASGTASAYSDGRPRSTHTYNGCVYVPGVGPALAGQVAVSPDGDFGTRALISFNESTGAATFRTAPSTSGASNGVACCFDSTRGTQGSVWRRNAGTATMQRYDVAADSWSNVGSSEALANMCSLAMHPSGDYILLGNGDEDLGQTRPWTVFDCSDGSYHTPTFTGSVSGGLWPGKAQPVWVPSLGCFCCWDNDTSRTLITTVTPGADPLSDEWTVGSLSVDGGNAVTPSAAQANGTFGRFAYWPAADGFVLLNSTTHGGYFFKL